MLSRLSKGDAALLMNAAKIMESEAVTWVEGFACMRNGRLFWDKEDAFAEVRYVRLTSSANSLRELAGRTYRELEYHI